MFLTEALKFHNIIGILAVKCIPKLKYYMNRPFILLLVILSSLVVYTSCDTTKRNTRQEPVATYPAPGSSTSTTTTSRPAPIQVLDDGNFNDLMKSGNNLKVAYFWATWCGPCRTIAPAVENISREYEGRMVLGKIDVDMNGATSIINDVKSIPTFIFFKNGEEVHRSTGLVTEQYLKNIIDRVL